MRTPITKGRPFLDGDVGLFDADGTRLGSVKFSEGSGEIHAAFIVKAVNNFDELVAIAKAYVDLIRSDYEGRDGSIGGGMGSVYRSAMETLEKTS